MKSPGDEIIHDKTSLLMCKKILKHQNNKALKKEYGVNKNTIVEKILTTDM